MKRLRLTSLFLILIIVVLTPLGGISSAKASSEIAVSIDNRPIYASEGNYFFVFNSQKVNANDLAAIKGYANKFKNTQNILFDSSKYSTATQLYDALKSDQKKRGGKVAGIQIFGLASDVPSFTYTNKMKFSMGNAEWNGIEENKTEKYVSDYLYSNFKNNSKYLNDVSVYGIVQQKLPINVTPEWPVSRLPLTKGEIARYISNYDAYREQIDGKSVPTAVFSAPYQIQDGIGQDDIGLFMKRLKEDGEFGLFENTEQSFYYKDLPASLKKENKSGVADFVVGAKGDKSGTSFFDRKSVTSLNSNYYTALLWGFDGANGLDAESVVHDGLAKGKMINPIALTVQTFNRGALNALWMRVPAPEGETGDDWYDYVPVNKELLEMDNQFFFVYKYYEAISSGKTRLQSFFEADVAYAALTVAHKDTAQFIGGFNAYYSAQSFAYLFSMHYLGLADY